MAGTLIRPATGTEVMTGSVTPPGSVHSFGRGPPQFFQMHLNSRDRDSLGSVKSMASLKSVKSSGRASSPGSTSMPGSYSIVQKTPSTISLVEHWQPATRQAVAGTEVQDRSVSPLSWGAASPVRTRDIPVVQETMLVPPEAASLTTSTTVSPAINDLITKQIWQFREVVTQDLQRTLQAFQAKTSMFEELVQRFDSDSVSKASLLQGLRNDFDRQQVQISDLVQSRLTTSAVQEHAQRERDLEMSSLMEKVRKDMEMMRNQQRELKPRDIPVQSDKNQEIDQLVADLRKDFDAMKSELAKVRTAQQKMKDTGLARAQELQKDTLQNAMSELSMHKEHLVSHRDHQQKLETVILDLRKELQAAQASISEHKDEVGQYKNEAKEELNGIKDDVRMINSLVRDLPATAASDDLLGKTVELHIQRLSHTWEPPQMKKQVVGLQDNMKKLMSMGDRMEQLEESQPFLRSLEANVKKMLSMGERMQQLEARLEEFRLAFAKMNVQEVARVLHEEKKARLELADGLNSYRDAHGKTVTELRTLINSQNERLSVLEATSGDLRNVHDRSLKNLEKQFESNSRKAQEKNDAKHIAVITGHVDEMKELKRTVEVEMDSRIKMSQAMDAYQLAHLKTCTELRKDIDEALERLEAVDHAHSQIRDSHSDLQTDHSEHVSRITDMDLHVKETFAALHAHVEAAHQKLEDFRASGSTAEDLERLAALINAESSQRDELINALEQQMEGALTAENQHRVELRAELDVALEKLSFLESVAQEQRDLHESAVANLEQGVSEIRKLFTGGAVSDAFQIQGTLEALISSLQEVAADLHNERQARAEEAAAFQSGLIILQERLETTGDSREDHQLALRQLEGTVSELKQSISASSLNGQAVLKDAESEVRNQAKETEGLQAALQIMRDKSSSLETSAAQDRGWRKQAVSDVKHILGDLGRVSPTATSPNRMLPTLATALRLSKTGSDAEGGV